MEDDEELDELEEELRDNMYCDTYGYCEGISCPNWINCHN